MAVAGGLRASHLERDLEACIETNPELFSIPGCHDLLKLFLADARHLDMVHGEVASCVGYEDGNQMRMLVKLTNEVVGRWRQSLAMALEHLRDTHSHNRHTADKLTRALNKAKERSDAMESVRSSNEALTKYLGQLDTEIDRRRQELEMIARSRAQLRIEEEARTRREKERRHANMARGMVPPPNSYRTRPPPSPGSEGVEPHLFPPPAPQEIATYDDNASYSTPLSPPPPPPRPAEINTIPDPPDASQPTQPGVLFVPTNFRALCSYKYDAKLVTSEILHRLHAFLVNNKITGHQLSTFLLRRYGKSFRYLDPRTMREVTRYLGTPLTVTESFMLCTSISRDRRVKLQDFVKRVMDPPPIILNHVQQPSPKSRSPSSSSQRPNR